MNRRVFFRAFSGQAARLEIDCESLYMRYVDARADGSTQSLLSRLDAELHRASVVRLREPWWISSSELEREIAPRLTAFETRGGIVERL